MAEIKNLKKAAQRIKKAIKAKENIVLYSDADLDGTVSLLILEETIKNLDGKISARYFPDRGEEGYGLTTVALKILRKYSPALLLLTDSGISNLKEAELATEMGFEIIVIDHHEILNPTPSSYLIVNPKQKGDKYPFKFMAACGLCFKLAQLILGDKISESLKQSFLELVALATIVDMMPQTDDNRFFIDQGLSSLHSTFRPGLRAFFKIFPPEDLSLRELSQKIISLLQITDLKDHLTESYLLLSASDPKKAQQLVKSILEKNSRRQELLQSFVQEVSEKFTSSSLPIIFEGGPDFPHILSGTLASRICNKFKKPTFIFGSNNKLSRGSVRTPKGIDGVKALHHCNSLLEIYGGHPQAAGFTVLKENLNKLEECLTDYFKN